MNDFDGNDRKKKWAKSDWLNIKRIKRRINYKLFVLVILSGSFVLTCTGQNATLDSLKGLLVNEKVDTNKISLLLKISSLSVTVDPLQAISSAAEAKELSEKTGDLRGIAYAYKYDGGAKYYQGNYVEAMDSWNRAMKILKQIDDKEGIASIQNNIGIVYLNQGNDTKALEHLFEFLRNAELTGNQTLIGKAYNNIGAAYQHKFINYDKALKYYFKALPIYQKINDNYTFGAVCGNIGEIYLDQKNADSAIYYFKKEVEVCKGTADLAYALYDIGRVFESKGNNDSALYFQQNAYDTAQKYSSKLFMVSALKEVASIYLKKGELKSALQKYHEAEGLAQEIESSYDLKDVYMGLARTYSGLRDYPKAFKYQSLLLDIKDSIYNKETDQKLARFEFDFEIEKKQSEINLLEKTKQLQELDLKRQKFAKNAFIVGFGLIMIIAFIIYRNYRDKVRVNKILDSQKLQIEQLLRNILPDEVAQELQTNGTATPKFYESVSVLFTDFKGFTRIADHLSPQEVVSELNTCFVAFDDIIEKYGLEKIKTIGDSYMCAGGIPVEKENHVFNMVRAGMEIQEYITRRNSSRVELGLEPWNIRVGVHVGPIVAGVVGKKKYAYDIWGSTVNIASRMESNGEPGRVNVSNAIYELIKSEYECTYRGKISAKNIGEIDMYFVEREVVKESFLIDPSAKTYTNTSGYAGV
ncbi:MAG: adenylate/guanylate cyclase domain-containing protein [Bacteroidetes bacterium]|nr:MAG: adenylate/guanylate cyclase domain-containing protein [Bacteroidota bacterium]